MRLSIVIAVCGLFFTAAMTLSAQNTVSGVVEDKVSGELMAGVSIAVKGTSKGQVTDENGKFSIDAPSEGVLVFGFLGYKTLTVPISGRSVIDVTMESDINRLDEVVLMGYSSVKKTELSSSAVSLDGATLRTVTTSDLGAMLQGKVAGLTVCSSTGRPGAAATLRIRGTGSISAGSSPLYVVDGVVGGDVNPNDIESVTVLKDAGATSIYGASGAGGVIVITTKAAKKGQETVVDVNAKIGIKQILTGRFSMMDSNELLDYYHTFMSKGNLKAFPDELRKTNYDWLDEGTRLGLTQDYYVSASGSKGPVSYLMGLTYYDEKGTSIFADYDKFNANINLNAEVAKNFDVRLRANYKTDRSTYGDIIGLGPLPFDSPYDERTGEYVKITGAKRPDNGKTWYYHDKYNPFWAPSVNSSTGSTSFFSGDLVLNWNITDYLTASSTNRYTDSYYHASDLIVPEANHGTYPDGRILKSMDWGKSFQTTNILKFSKSFKNTHSVTAFIGYEWSTSWSEYMSASGVDMTAGLTQLGTSSPETVGGGRTEIESYSYFAYAQYSYKEKYIFNATFRADASSVFAPKSRVGYFPSVSAAWLISAEDFMQNQNVLSFLKLRASYGTTGNSGLKPYSYLDVYYFPQRAQYQGVPGGIPSTMSNPDLRWETAVKANLGLDITFGNFLTLNIDFYNNENRDLLLDNPLSPSSGFQSRIENIGRVRNRGVEATISADIFNRKNFKWSSSFNIGHNRNVVVSLPNHEDIILAEATGGQIYREGAPLYSWYMTKWLGVNPENGDPQWEHLITDDAGNVVGTEPTSRLDMTKDRQIVGCAQPDFAGGFSNVLSFYGFSVSLDLSFMYGNEVFNFDRRTGDSDGAYTDINQMSHNNGLGWSRWSEKGDIATHPRPKMGGNRSSNEATSRYLEDGSYLRVKNLKIGYSLPGKVLESLHLKGADVYLSGDNLLTFTKFSGMDPEVGVEGRCVGQYPISRFFSMGINIKF